MAISDSAATWVGIQNENEFYSHHYLSEVFQGDIKARLQEWAEREQQAKEAGDDWRAPWTGLRNLAREYFVTSDRLRRERAAKNRIGLQRGLFRQFMTVLGHGWRPHDMVLEEGGEIPVLGTAPEALPELVVLGALDPDHEGIDPLELRPVREQFHGGSAGAPPAFHNAAETAALPP